MAAIPRLGRQEDTVWPIHPDWPNPHRHSQALAKPAPGGIVTARRTRTGMS
jgi:hypothetical protein